MSDDREQVVGQVGQVGQVGVASDLGLVAQAGRDIHLYQAGSVCRVVWPVRVGVPPGVADHYREREAGKRLTEALAVDGTSMITGVRPGVTVVVSGLGGVGKSQVAARFAWSVWQDASTDLAVWVSALSRDAVVTGYAKAAQRVLREQDPGIAERAPEEAAELLVEWLASCDRRWLVVLDDLQDPQDVTGLWPPRTPSGRVVVTTRRRDASLTRDPRVLVELDVYTESEAVDYLTLALPGNDAGVESLRGLAEDLGRLPLALTYAAAFITDKPLMTVTEYRTRFAARYPLAHVMPTMAELPDKHQRTVSTTWSLSMEHADQLSPQGLARPLLELASLLGPNGTPLAVFTSPPVLEYLARILPRDVSESEVRDGLGCLHRLSLITLDPAQPQHVSTHALVQRAVRDDLPRLKVARLARVAADALLTVWPEVDSTDPHLAQALRTATEILHANTTPALWHPKGHPVLFRVGGSLGATGQVTAAVDHFTGLHDQARTRLHQDHPDLLDILHEIAHWRGLTGDPYEVVEDLEVVLAESVRVLGPQHPDTMTTRASLAGARGEAGDPDDAITELKAVLADMERVLGPDDPETLINRGNLARWRGEDGDPVRAAAEYELLYADVLRVLGSDHPQTLTVRGNLAYWLGEAGDPAHALIEHKALLTDALRVWGPDHPHTLTVRHNIAHAWVAAGDPTRAVTELKVVLADRERVLDPQHRDILSASITLLMLEKSLTNRESSAD